MKNVYMKTGGELKHRRIALGMTQREVAEKAGMTPQSIIEIEKGRRGMSLETLERLCKVLEIKINLKAMKTKKDDFLKEKKEKIEELLTSIFEVKGVDDLAAYVYNHGNNPIFQVVKKKDVMLVRVSEKEWEKKGGYGWITRGKVLSATEDERDEIECFEDCGITFYDLIYYAGEYIDKAWEWANDVRNNVRMCSVEEARRMM